MAIVLTCPECEASLKLASRPAPGKKVRCPKCQAIFAPEEPEARRQSAERPAAPVRSRPAEDEDEEEEDDREERRSRRPSRRRRKQSSGNAVLIGLLVGGVLVLLTGVGIGGYVLYSRAQAVSRASQVPPVVVAQPNVGNAALPAPAQANAGPAGNAAPKVDGNPPPAPPPPIRKDAVTPGLYGDQGGEAVAPADPSLPNTLLRVRAADTFYKLSNPRLGTNRFGRPELSVDYEIVKVGKYHGLTLIVHGDDGRREQWLLIGPTDSHGTLHISHTFGGPGRAFPTNFEVYLIRGDARYGANAPTFKVSNSATVGMMTRLTRPRDWTPEEIARLSKPPPNYTNANAHPDVGQDTPFAGDSTGGSLTRYVEPPGLLLGLEYRLGEWDGEKCIGGLVPVFSRDQPANPALQRVLAKEGYAVGGAKVRSKRYVDAIQLVYMRVKADGQLDPADSYTSDWFGDAGEQPLKTLAGDGRRVLGINCRQGAILNGLALVLEKNGAAKP